MNDSKNYRSLENYIDRKLEANLNELKSGDEFSQKYICSLNGDQIKFLKRFIKFKKKLLKKLRNDNFIIEKYVIVMSGKTIQQSNSYIFISNTMFYYCKVTEKIKHKYRLLDERERIELAVEPSVAFLPMITKYYRSYFLELITVLREIIKDLDQFTIGTIKGLSEDNVINKLKYDQLF